MEAQWYTVDQIAKQLGMHHKTIRKFIREGKLLATRVGKQWRISEADFTAFLESRRASPGREASEAAPQRNSIVDGADTQSEPVYVVERAAGDAYTPRVQVSTVVDIEQTDQDEYIRLSNTLIAIANCKDPELGKSSIHVTYNGKDRRTRVILWGTVKYMETMLESISMLVESQTDT